MNTKSLRSKKPYMLYIVTFLVGKAARKSKSEEDQTWHPRNTEASSELWNDSSMKT